MKCEVLTSSGEVVDVRVILIQWSLNHFINSSYQHGVRRIRSRFRLTRELFSVYVIVRTLHSYVISVIPKAPKETLGICYELILEIGMRFICSRANNARKRLIGHH